MNNPAEDGARASRLDRVQAQKAADKEIPVVQYVNGTDRFLFHLPSHDLFHTLTAKQLGALRDRIITALEEYAEAKAVKK